MVNTVFVSDVVFVRGDRILLVQQKKLSAFGRWGLPGGKAESGEAPLETALREVREELGIVLHDSFARDEVAHKGAGSGEEHLQITTYVAEMPDVEIHIQAEELLGLGWFTPGELRRMQPLLRSSWILGMAEKALG